MELVTKLVSNLTENKHKVCNQRIQFNWIFFPFSEKGQRAKVTLNQRTVASLQYSFIGMSMCSMGSNKVAFTKLTSIHGWIGSLTHLDQQNPHLFQYNY